MAAVSASKPSRPFILDRVAPAVVLILGALFRFVGLGSVRHGYDNSYQIYDAVRLLDGGRWPLLGQPSSVFLDNPPLMPYLQSVPLLLWRSPWAPYIFITALNTVAIWFVYALATELKGRKVGLIAAFLFAVNPWVVHFSRQTWTQGLLPFFLALAAWGLWPALVDRASNPRRLFIGLLAMAAMMLTYILAFAILVPLILLLLLFWRRLPQRPAVAGLLLLALALVLYGAGLTTRLAPNVQKLSNFTTGIGEGRAAAFTDEAAEHALRLVTGYEYLAPDRDTTPSLIATELAALVHWLITVALLAGGIRALFALRRPSADRRLAIVLGLWFLLPVLGFSLLPSAVHPHYLLLTLPAGQMVAAWGLSDLAERDRLQPFLALLLLAIGIVFGLALQQTAAAAAATPVPGNELEGWTLRSVARTGNKIRRATADVTDYPRRIYATGNSVLLSGASATYLEVVSGLSYPDFLLRSAQEPLLYVLINQQPQPTALAPATGTSAEPVLQLAGQKRVFLERALPADRAHMLAIPQTVVDWHSEAGLSLLGYDLAPSNPAPGEDLSVTTYWSVDSFPPGYLEWFVGAYYQVLNEDWQLLANVSGHGQWARRWQIGDIYIEHVTVPMPQEEGDYRLLLGLHDTIHGRQFSLASPDGPVMFITQPLPVEAE